MPRQPQAALHYRTTQKDASGAQEEDHATQPGGQPRRVSRSVSTGSSLHGRRKNSEEERSACRLPADRRLSSALNDMPEKKENQKKKNDVRLKSHLLKRRRRTSRRRQQGSTQNLSAARDRCNAQRAKKRNTSEVERAEKVWTPRERPKNFVRMY